MLIYYAHSILIYGTPKEKTESQIIQQFYSGSTIINPNTYTYTWRNNNLDSAKIMQECLKLVQSCDLLIFSSINLFVGKGVYTEVREAERLLKLIKLLWKETFWDYELHLHNRKNWILRYGKVKPDFQNQI